MVKDAIMKRLFSMSVMALGLALTTSFLSAAPSKAEEEAEYYSLVTVPIPEGVTLEAGAIQRFGKQRLAVSTRLGEIYFIDGAYAANPKPETVKFTRYASGLHEVLGLSTLGDGWFYVTQRGEVSRLRDTDGDDRADELGLVRLQPRPEFDEHFCGCVLRCCLHI